MRLVFCHYLKVTTSTLIGHMRRRESLLLDIIAYSSFPVALCVVHFLIPAGVRESFVFDHSAPSIFSMWTASLVHASVGHLTGNLVGYAVSAIPVFWLFFFTKKEGELRRIMFIILLIFPFVISGAGYAFYQWILVLPKTSTRGFSGLVGAMFGLLYAGLVWFVYYRTDRRLAGSLATLLVLLSMGMILFYANRLTSTVIGLVTFGTGLLLVELIPKQIANPEFRHKIRSRHLEEVLIVFSGAVVIVVGLPTLFPVDWIRSNSVINIFSHFVGFLLGVFLTSAFESGLAARGHHRFTTILEQCNLSRSRTISNANIPIERALGIFSILSILELFGLIAWFLSRSTDILSWVLLFIMMLYIATVGISIWRIGKYAKRLIQKYWILQTKKNRIDPSTDSLPASLKKTIIPFEYPLQDWKKPENIDSKIYNSIAQLVITAILFGVFALVASHTSGLDTLSQQVQYNNSISITVIAISALLGPILAFLLLLGVVSAYSFQDLFVISVVVYLPLLYMAPAIRNMSDALEIYHREKFSSIRKKTVILILYFAVNLPVLIQPLRIVFS